MIRACYSGLWGRTIHGYDADVPDQQETLCGRDIGMRMSLPFYPPAAGSCRECAERCKESQDGS